MPTLDKQSIVLAAEKLAACDAALASVLDRLGPPPLWKRPATFATFIRIILEQQVSELPPFGTRRMTARAAKSRRGWAWGIGPPTSS